MEKGEGIMWKNMWKMVRSSSWKIGWIDVDRGKQMCQQIGWLAGGLTIHPSTILFLCYFYLARAAAIASKIQEGSIVSESFWDTSEKRLRINDIHRSRDRKKSFLRFGIIRFWGGSSSTVFALNEHGRSGICSMRNDLTKIRIKTLWQFCYFKVWKGSRQQCFIIYNQ